MTFFYKTADGEKCQVSGSQLEALREIIKRERMNGYTGGITMWSYAARMRGA